MQGRDAGPAFSGKERRPPDKGVLHELHVLGAEGGGGTDDDVHGSLRSGDENDRPQTCRSESWHSCTHGDFIGSLRS